MNRITRIAAIALSITAAGLAQAESPTQEPAQAIASASQPMTMRSAAPGVVTEADLNRTDAVASTKTRAEVRAETRAAIASGELRALASESNAFDQPWSPAQRSAAGVQHTARVGR